MRLSRRGAAVRAVAPCLAALAGCLGAAAGTVAGGAAGPRTGATGATATHRVALGAWVSPAPLHSRAAQEAAVEALERALGRRLAIDEFYLLGLPAPTGWIWRARWDRDAGRIPLVTLGAGVSTADVAAGRDDRALLSIRRALLAVGGSVLVRYGPEPENAANASWAGSSASYRAAFAHVHALLAAPGIRLVWSLDAGTFGDPAKAGRFWPGSAAVDWIGADGYNWYTCRGATPWRSFDQAFAAFYRWAAGRGKPLIVSEFGTVEDTAAPGRKAAWLADLPAQLARLPRLSAVVYFDSNRDCPWRLTTSSSALAGFARSARSAELTGALR